jgi:uncharacterized membrane protein
LKKEERVWEVDFLRGIAVLLMLVSNFVFDLSLFSYLHISDSFFWSALARVTASLFLILAGISLTLSRAKAPRAGFLKFFKRGLKIFALGLLISLATWCAVGDDLVLFGILHLIGLGIILAYPFIRHPYISLFAAVLVFAGGWLASRVLVSFPWLIWLGIEYYGFSSVDFTPVFPWFGFMLLGIFLGNLLFPEGKRKMGLTSVPPLLPSGLLQKIGRRSLFIYLVHQPVFWAGFWGWQLLCT